MELSPDQRLLWAWGVVRLNATIVMTWLVMAVMTVVAALVTRRLRTDLEIPRWQGLLEVVVTAIEGQLREVGLADARRHLPFLGTLFLFVAVSALLTVVPGYVAPTGSLSTTTALALLVFVAVPVHGIRARGVRGYLASYVQPTPLMLPFNVVGELSRTLALAIRLFGNVMSGAMIAGMLLTVTPFLFPVAMTLFGLLTGVVQAYIFLILAAVFIAAATQAQAAAASRTGAAAPSTSHSGSTHE
jgi:F-type H+-transporting ATPase subunit a